MAKAENLSEKTFGYLKVIERTEDHISRSGQKKVRWLCECLLCGNKKVVNAQDLKRGSVVSCGCYKVYKGKLTRNKKICLICGKEFESPPSDKTVTCSKECRREYAKIRKTGKPMPDDVKKIISVKAKGRDLSILQTIAVQAAKQSPNSGRFPTNVNTIDWHLISPGKKHYYFHSLSSWLRENGEELFGCKPDSKEYNNVRSGLSGAKRAVLGKNYSCCTYKGWQVIPTESDLMD